MGLLIFREVQHLPALTYLRKTEEKLGSKQTEREKWKPKHLMSIKQIMISHRTPYFPCPEEIVQAYPEM